MQQDIIDTGALLASPKAFPVRADGHFSRGASHKPSSRSAIERVQCQVCLSIDEREQIMQYGLWQDYGTGRETPRGNSGDIGRAKVRQRRKWFSRKYYASVMNIKEFYEDNIGKAFTDVLSDFARRCNKDVIKVMYSRFNYEICRIFALWKKTRTSLSRKINKCCPRN